AIGDEDAFVDVVVEGVRYVVGSVKPEDISVTATVSGVNGSGVFSLPLKGENISKKDFSVVSVTPSTMQVKFDRMVTKKFSVETDLGPVSVPDGYMTEDVIISPSEVNVTGPDADIAQIARCVVNVSLQEEPVATQVLKGEILLYDKDGNRIETNELTMDQTEAEITVPVLKTTKMPLTVEFLNVPEGFPLEEMPYQLSNETITVAGPVDEIEHTTELVIGYIDFKNLTLESAYLFNLNLPEGFINVENVEQVSVQFDTSQMAEQYFNLSDIRIINQPVDFDVTVLTRYLSNVQVIGPQTVLAGMTADDLIAQIDLSDRELTAGQSSYPVSVYAPTKGLVWATGEHSVILILTEKNS
ncbi:MAG: CdaR family protein, partial [Oscillospiraceae bacterium]|nr:CdaR family protein [Oscillospiraceae bacterium]